MLNMGKLHFSAFMLSLHYFMAYLALSKPNITTDKSALLAFKSSILDPYDLLANWSNSSSPCNWAGVTCNTRHARVQALNLGDMGLNGTISPRLGNLSFLIELDLRNNNFHGQLPKELVQLRRLKLLNLNSNEFDGEVPTWIGDLSTLQHLYLRNNSFSGIIPLSISNLSMLETLDWNYNSIEGTIPLEIGSLEHLKILRIAGNKLSGIIPQTISNLSSLELLSLSYNTFSGGIPKEIGDLPQARIMYLGSNKLFGFIPSTIFNSSVLQQIELFDNNLSGSLLSNLCHGLPKLELLYLYSNDFFGAMPSVCEQCKELKELELSNNGFKRGYIPSDIGNLTNLQSLYLAKNNLEGEIPEEMCHKLPSLKIFNLFGNKLEGSIPKSTSNCTSLKELYLDGNSFTGFIPKEIDFLQRLNIMIDVASALEYLHHGSSTPVVHCDVKPSNVLLDEDMVAHLTDFGIAKLLGEGQFEIHTKTLATLGYIAPEYGSKGIVSMKGDVYSYGILLMEVFTRKKPTDDMFVQGLSLKDWVSKSTPHSIIHIIDSNLFQGYSQNIDDILPHISSILELALNCCSELPETRINMIDIVVSLSKIKAMFIQNGRGHRTLNNY